MADFGQADFGQTEFDLCLCVICVVCLCVFVCVVWRGCWYGFGGFGAAGASHDNQRAQTCTFEGPGLQKHHQNSTRRVPEREEKNEFCGGRGKKKREILGPPPFGPPPFAPPLFLGLGPHPSPLPTLLFLGLGPWPAQKTKQLKKQFFKIQTINFKHLKPQFWPKGQSRFWPKSVWAKVGFQVLAKVGLAKVGRITMAKSRFGQSRFRPELRHGCAGAVACR